MVFGSDVEHAEARLLEEGEDAVGSAPIHWRLVTGVVSGAVLALGAVALQSSSSTPTDAALRAMTQLSSSPQCSALGDNCQDSKCCVDGGNSGFQCYSKDDVYAECMEYNMCKEGVHEGEKHGIWDASGTFVLDSWSCDEHGTKSKPGCDSFASDSECPETRCVWNSDANACRIPCEKVGDLGTCWDTGYCMWYQDSCLDACWEFDDDTCASEDRCLIAASENGTECKLACEAHADEGSCPHEEKCIWVDGACSPDPCSAQWEDCRETKCCSTARGAAGMQCFEKDDDYASCLNYLDPEYQANWTGKALGERTKFDVGCSWAGQDCSATHACCNTGFNCAVKDDIFSGCAQAEAVSSWVKQEVALPEGWEGTILGGWHGEYAVAPAAPGQGAGTSLYCIMAVLPDSPEMALMEVAQKNTAGVFGCDAHSVYHSWLTAAAGWDTGEATLVNTAVFLKVFEWVKKDGIYLQHDWTVKADADCVFVPQRLREHIWGLNPPKDQAIYLKNNNLDKGMGNNGFLGAIEVFSKRAVQIYLDNDKDCEKYLGTDSGEDGFFKGCMDALGVGFMLDGNMFEPNFDPAICTDGGHAAFHPIKYPSHWQRCWDIAVNNLCPDVTYDCGGPLDPPISSAGVR